MPMDGITLGFIARELNQALAGGRIDKVNQPEKDSLVLLVRTVGKNNRLLLCASPNNARCHLTNETFLNPMEPPMFCMLLRKHLLGGRIVSIEQQRGDRIIHVNMEAVDELGETVARTLVLEIMSRYSNLILLDEKGRIIDAARHVSDDMSRVRQVLPGLLYDAPPDQGRVAPAEVTRENMLERLTGLSGPLARILANHITGLSAVAARELSFRLTNRQEAQLQDEDLPRLTGRLAGFMSRLPEMGPPVVQLDEEDQPADVYPFGYLSCDTARQQPAASLSAALERYFGQRDQKERIQQKSAALHRLLHTHIERCEKKLALQEQELSASQQMEDYRITGELITANLYQLKKGQEKVTLTDYYDPNGGSREILLDKQLTPSQNAQKYYKKYQKARSAQKTAAEQKAKTETELAFLENAYLDLGKCVEEAELSEIRQELTRAGYVRASHNRKPQRKLAESKPMTFLSPDDITICVGKNAAQNDRLTGGALGNYTWLHAKNMPGSHVIIETEQTPPDATLLCAAKLAAYFSKGGTGGNVPVDYTLRRYVKKPGGSPAGFVIYTNQRTLYITVTESEFLKIRKKDEQK